MWKGLEARLRFMARSCERDSIESDRDGGVKAGVRSVGTHPFEIG